MECHERTVVRLVKFLVQGNVNPALSEEQHYHYLGVPNESLESLAVKMGEHLQQIDSSLLAPWQILDAYHTFIQLFAAYTLCASDCQKKHLKKLCGELVKIAWKVCNLTTRATTNFVFARRMTPPEIITSAQLFSIVHRTIHHPTMEKETDLFLSGSMDGDLANSGNNLLSGAGPVQMQVG